MLSNTLEAIQTYFQDNWLVTPIMFGDQEFSMANIDTIRLDIFPIQTLNAGYTLNTNELHGVIVTAFARNQLQASKIMDQVTPFIKNADIPGIQYFKMEPKSQMTYVGQSEGHGGYLIKFLYTFSVSCSV